MSKVTAFIIAVGLAIGAVAISVILDVAIASLMIYVFDWIFDTQYLQPKYIAILTVILFMTSKIKVSTK